MFEIAWFFARVLALTVVCILLLLIVAGCSHKPEAWAMTPWSYAADQCEEYDRGLERIGCMREALHQLRYNQW